VAIWVVFVPIRGRFHVNITAAIVIGPRLGGGPGTEDTSCRNGGGSPYRSARSPHWVKVKNPNAPAVGTAKVMPNCFIVHDTDGQALSYTAPYIRGSSNMTALQGWIVIGLLVLIILGIVGIGAEIEGLPWLWRTYNP
jgi:hypothetical protein